MFLFTFEGPHGPRGLGAGTNLRAFTEGRIASGMLSAELLESLRQLRELGEARGWDFDAMAA